MQAGTARRIASRTLAGLLCLAAGFLAGRTWPSAPLSPLPPPPAPRPSTPAAQASRTDDWARKIPECRRRVAEAEAAYFATAERRKARLALMGMAGREAARDEAEANDLEARRLVETYAFYANVLAGAGDIDGAITAFAKGLQFEKEGGIQCCEYQAVSYGLQEEIDKWVHFDAALVMHALRSPDLPLKRKMYIISYLQSMTEAVHAFNESRRRKDASSGGSSSRGGIPGAVTDSLEHRK